MREIWKDNTENEPTVVLNKEMTRSSYQVLYRVCPTDSNRPGGGIPNFQTYLTIPSLPIYNLPEWNLYETSPSCEVDNTRRFQNTTIFREVCNSARHVAIFFLAATLSLRHPNATPGLIIVKFLCRPILRRHRYGDHCAVTRQTPITFLLYRPERNLRNKTDSQRDIMKTVRRALTFKIRASYI